MCQPEYIPKLIRHQYSLLKFRKPDLCRFFGQFSICSFCRPVDKHSNSFKLTSDLPPSEHPVYPFPTTSALYPHPQRQSVFLPNPHPHTSQDPTSSSQHSLPVSA